MDPSLSVIVPISALVPASDGTNDPDPSAVGMCEQPAGRGQVDFLVVSLDVLPAAITSSGRRSACSQWSGRGSSGEAGHVPSKTFSFFNSNC